MQRDRRESPRDASTSEGTTERERTSGGPESSNDSAERIPRTARRTATRPGGSRGGWEARIRIDSKTRQGYDLVTFGLDDEDGARERCTALATIVGGSVRQRTRARRRRSWRPLRRRVRARRGSKLRSPWMLFALQWWKDEHADDEPTDKIFPSQTTCDPSYPDPRLDDSSAMA